MLFLVTFCRFQEMIKKLKFRREYTQNIIDFLQICRTKKKQARSDPYKIHANAMRMRACDRVCIIAGDRLRRLPCPIAAHPLPLTASSLPDC